MIAHMYLTQLTLPLTEHTRAVITRFVRNRYAQHQVLWELADAPPEANRDFLYRTDAIEQGLRVLVLSNKPFARASEPWMVRTIEYRPVFEAQQPLQFRLRFSPMVTLATRRGERGALTNLVEHIRREDTSGRTLDDIVDEAARRWLTARAQPAGFALGEYACGNYQNASALQYRSGRRYLVPSIDVEGTLTVTDPGLFLATHLQGIGRARHAGCGLLLTKPVAAPAA